MIFHRVVLPRGAKVLLLEDSEMRIEWFKKRIPNLIVLKSVKEFTDYFENKGGCDFIFFDHDLGEGGIGLDAIKFLKERFGSVSRWGVIHSWNRAGARAMQDLYPMVACIPFGEFEIEFE
jgi:hypothetical protein